MLGGGIQRCVQRFNAAIASLNAFAHSFTLGAELGHRAFEGAKVVDHGLVDQDVAISQKQNALFCAAFPQAPDDLEGGVGLASARGHDEERAVLPSADGLDRAVDDGELVVARLFVALIGLGVDFCGLRTPAFMHAELAPKLLGAGEGIHGQVAFQRAGLRRGITEHERLAVAGKGEWHIEQTSVFDGLLHAGFGILDGFFRLDHGQRDVFFVEQHVIGMQHRAGIAAGLAPPHDHAACAQRELAQPLGLRIPTGLRQSGRNQLFANVGFGIRHKAGRWRHSLAWHQRVGPASETISRCPAKPQILRKIGT